MPWTNIGNIRGPAGATGAGVPAGGSTGQVLAKTSAADYATGWATPGGVSDGDKTDITVSGSGATWTIDANVVTNTKLADMPASTVKGNHLGTSGDPVDMTVSTTKTLLALDNVNNTTDANKPVSTAQATAIGLKADKATTITPTAPLTGGGSLAANRTLDISTFTATVKGAVPPPTTATGKFLKDDGTWAVPAGGGTSDHGALTGLTPDDDHPQYVKKAGDTMTGGLDTPGINGPAGVPLYITPDAGQVASFNNSRLANVGTPTATTDATTKAYVDSHDMPVGGAAGQVLSKIDATNYNTQWVTPAGGSGLTDGDKTDITVSGSGATWVIDPNVVDNTKLADMATARIKGRVTAATGDPEDLTAAQVKTVLALTKSDVGLGNVDNTSDANAPVSTAQAAADALKADKTTTISTTAPLAGGGDLSANRTLTVAAASLTAQGVVELATTAEATAQTDATRAVTPAGLADRVLTSRSIATTAPLAGGGNLTADRTLTLNADGVTNTYLANMAANTIKGNNTGSSADPLDLTAAQVKTLLGIDNITVASSAPGSPAVNDIWIDTT